MSPSCLVGVDEAVMEDLEALGDPEPLELPEAPVRSRFRACLLPVTEDPEVLEVEEATAGAAEAAAVAQRSASCALARAASWNPGPQSNSACKARGALREEAKESVSSAMGADPAFSP